jgi:hypothetical protein
MSKIFVFGSNEAGRHGKGAAKFAHQNFGAIYGQGSGWQGNSYAIPTKDKNLKPLPLSKIKEYVDVFLISAKSYSQYTFQLTPIGCGLAGYRPEDIAPMFKDASINIELPTEFKEILNG